MECVIDAHTHLPIQPPTSPRELLDNLLNAGVRGIVILGVPPASQIVRELSYELVVSEYERVRDLIEKHAHELKDRLRPGVLYYSVINLLRRFGTLCDYEPKGRGYVILAAVDLSLGHEELSKRLETLISKGYRGFKIVSTLQFKFLDDPAVETVFEVAQDKGVPVVVHAGCDPGIWELPRFCKYGNPSRLERVLRRYRDVDVVIAHVGGYSAIAPGVFTEETISLVRSFQNVYVDTSAVPVFIVKRVASAIPRGRILFGSDYPVVDYEDVAGLIEMTRRALRSAGYTREELEETFHGLAERLFGVDCV